ncbi:hypothetical protein [Desertivirga brevis]|nr:hypothetical protein [Pedobacter sp. SYSU D00873]
MSKKQDVKKPKMQVDKTAKGQSAYQSEKSGKSDVKGDDSPKHGKKK